ncbi:MAG: phosphodiester glycosidase family protein [Deltaproteobacteria bacterium]|nr:phosphodiester glycosidase family protein [Myxococcales bacterium]MDP3217094.1 phosphodiester glycosidase family protein [Deltaproteobacteria bacterium]
MRSPVWSLLLACALAAPAASAQIRWRTYRPGIRIGETDTATQHWWAVTVDLQSPRIGVRATRAADHGITVSTFAQRYGAQVAINGGFFNFSGYVPSGLSMADGRAWHDDSAGESFVAVGADGRVEYQRSPGSVVRSADLPDWYRQAVGGHPTLVWDGASVTTPCPAGAELCTARHPRTASGVSRDGRTLYLITVDGRMTGSAGMTLPELAAVMRNLGVWRGINHDGGGSTTLFVAGSGVLNRPSDGRERVVANHLGIVWRDPRCTGTVRGTVRDRATRRPLAGASVSIVGGGTDRADAMGAFSIGAVSCDVVTLRATAAGHVAGMREVPVDPLSVSDGSITLAATPSPMDAGTVRDAGMVRDTGTRIDVTVGVDMPRVDVQTTDRATADVGTADVEPADVGTADVGMEDVGAEDVGAEDDVPTVIESDGSTTEWDGGADADEAPPEAMDDAAGCQCTAGVPTAPGRAAPWMGLLGLALLRRRGRRGSGVWGRGRRGR